MDSRQDEVFGCYNGSVLTHDFVEACFQICSIRYPCFWIFVKVMKVFTFELPSQTLEYGPVESLMAHYLP